MNAARIVPGDENCATGCSQPVPRGTDVAAPLHPSSFILHRSVVPRRGFTLVELLVAIAIIGILASLALGVMYSAQQAARRGRTRALMTKLNGQMMIRWESYRTRRLPLELLNPDPNTGELETVQDFATRQLLARRELMRMELPDRYKDILFVPDAYIDGTRPIRPSLWFAYRQRIEGVPGIPPLDSFPDPEAAFEAISLIAAERANPDAPDQNQSAECLYMIMTTAMEADNTGRPLFGEDDVADTDTDGMPEFIDGWGQPINWLRWAPEFVSDLQKSLDRDPFDPRGVDTWRFDPSQEDDPSMYPITEPRGYALYPLILSRGPDAERGLYFGHVRFDTPMPRLWIKDSDPYAAYTNSAGDYWRRGRPRTLDFGGHLDNIDSHSLETR